MAIMFPVSGGYYTLVDRFVDRSYAFAMGWVRTMVSRSFAIC